MKKSHPFIFYIDMICMFLLKQLEVIARPQIIRIMSHVRRFQGLGLEDAIRLFLGFGFRFLVDLVGPRSWVLRSFKQIDAFRRSLHTNINARLIYIGLVFFLFSIMNFPTVRIF